jgi:hypothetical protein
MHLAYTHRPASQLTEPTRCERVMDQKLEGEPLRCHANQKIILMQLAYTTPVSDRLRSMLSGLVPILAVAI